MALTSPRAAALRSRAAVAVLCLTLTGMALTGCSAAEDAADSAAGAVKAEASEQASKAAAAAKSKAAAELAEAERAAKAKAAAKARTIATGQICALVGDGTVSASDLAQLRGLIAGARTAGVSNTLLAPVQQLVTAGATKGKEAAARAVRAEAACT